MRMYANLVAYRLVILGVTVSEHSFSELSIMLELGNQIHIEQVAKVISDGCIECAWCHLVNAN